MYNWQAFFTIALRARKSKCNLTDRNKHISIFFLKEAVKKLNTGRIRVIFIKYGKTCSEKAKRSAENQTKQKKNFIMALKTDKYVIYQIKLSNNIA